MAPEIANFSSLFSPYSLFATITGDIYVDNGRKNNRIEKLASDATKSVTVMNVNHSCLGLFVDINNDLYCSMESYHQVIKTSLINDTNTTEIVAGNGSNGSLPNMLDYPRGIFVDINLDLYVADHKNHRIQRFASGQLNGITVASGDTLTFPLRFPTGIVLDADNYLFIVDNNNHRIIGSGPYGFRCLVGCSGKSTSASNELSYPNTLSFDSFGNMFVADTGNNRIQKFFLATNSCGKCQST
jgi:DNA-binding beta-propeller fold protein YncE